MKSNSKNSKSKLEENNIQILQKKIRDQAKRLCSMQDYINNLESTIKENKTNNSFKMNQSYKDLSNRYNDLQLKYNSLFINSQINSTKPSYSNSSLILNDDLNKEDLISKLTKENSDLKFQLQNEINKNKNQQNQIEFLKQNLETDIVKNGLRGCLNYLTEKLINNDKDGEDAYFQILSEISKIKEENSKLLEEKSINEKKIEEFEKNIENFQNNVDIINKLNNENNNLFSHNEMLEKELKLVKNNLIQTEEILRKSKEENYIILKENEILHNDNNKLIGLKKENENLINSLNELEKKINKLTNENNSLSDYRLGYNLVLKENNEIRKINQDLSYENELFEHDVVYLKTNLDKLMDVGKNNVILKNELDDLKNLLINLKNRKQVNGAFEKMEELEKRNKDLESLLNIKEIDNNNNISKNSNLNKSNHLDNLNYINNAHFNDIIKNYNNLEVKNNKNKINKLNDKYILGYKYLADLLLRIIKYHIKDDINLKNILFQLLDLNNKKLLLNLDIENLININNSKSGKANKNLTKENENKKKNELNKKQKELEILRSTISYFDKELKQFEDK